MPTIKHIQNELEQARCARPFDVLGAHPLEVAEDGEEPGRHSPEWRLLAWFPGAKSVRLLDWQTGASAEQLEPLGNQGLFRLMLSEVRHPPYHCRYEVRYEQLTVERIDPYQLSGPAFQDFEHDAATLYRNLGAHLCTVNEYGREISGVRFAVYAPHARSVSVVGDFNHWDGRAHPMGASGDGIWRLFLPDVEAGAGYKFEIRSQHGDLLPHKTDPFAFRIDQFPSFASRVESSGSYEWGDADWQGRPAMDPLKQPMNIYEVHVGSWRRHEGRVLTYEELARDLVPYLVYMGYTHVELMPISEHPFTGSWGYQPVGMFASTSRYGTPDQFRHFVDTCHQAGIGVLLDWVPAHFPTDGHGLANFDGTPLYEYPDPRKGWHPEWNSLIYDFGREHVCQFLISSAMYWLESFHIDGLRVDAVASMLYLDYSRKHGEWVPNEHGGNHNLEAIAFLKRLNETVYLNFPRTLMIAEESTAFPGVSRATFEGGLGFGFKWNMGWMNDTLRYLQRDHVYRSYHHNELTFGMMYAYTEHFVLPISHDEVVHGKNSLVRKMPGDEWQKFANLRAFTCYQLTHPGKSLSFMGNEFAQHREWNYEVSLDWHLLDQPSHHGQQRLTRDVNRLYSASPALWELDYDSAGFNWLVADDHANSVLAYARFAEDRSSHLLVVINLTPVPRQQYRIGVPGTGPYEIVLNSDEQTYGGSGYEVNGTCRTEAQSVHGQDRSIELDIPPLACLILRPAADAASQPSKLSQE